MTEDAALRALTRRRLGLLALYGLTVAAYGAAILLILVDLRAAVVVVNGATLFYILAVRRADRSYNLAFAQASLLWGCAREMQDVQVSLSDRRALRYPQVAASGLIPARVSGGVASALSMRARAGGISALVCETAICYNLNGTKRNKVALHNGVWVELGMQQTPASRVVLVPEAVMDGGICPDFYLGQGLHRLDGAPEGWAVFADDDIAAARLLRKGAAVLRKAEKNRAHLMLSVRENRLSAFLTPRSLSFSTPVLGQLTPELLEWDRLPELAWLLELARLWESMPREKGAAPAGTDAAVS